MKTSEVIGEFASEDTMVSGGLQQYLIKNRSKESCPQPIADVDGDLRTFHDLPDSVQLHVFSLLGVRDLCVASLVCRHWYSVSSDEVFWRQRLERDVHRWGVVSHSTYPHTYQTSPPPPSPGGRQRWTIHTDMHEGKQVATNQNTAAATNAPDSLEYRLESESCGTSSTEAETEEARWTSKEIYLRCSPEVAWWSKRSNSHFHVLSNLLRALWPRKSPRVAMFGPGLEASTSGLVRKILECRTGLFTTLKMFPGRAGGVGSGFTLRMTSGVTLDLITLYTATKDEREGRSSQQRALDNRLMAPGGAGGAGGEQGMNFDLQPHVKELCRDLGAFVLIVDVTETVESIALCRAELCVMLHAQWTRATAPLLVLACVPHINSARTLSCVQLVQALHLDTLTRPWQVCSCVVDTMEGVTTSFQWLVETCHQN